MPYNLNKKKTIYWAHNKLEELNQYSSLRPTATLTYKLQIIEKI